MTKGKYTITLSNKVVNWINKNIENRRFGSVSHAIEYLIWNAMKDDNSKDDSN